MTTTYTLTADLTNLLAELGAYFKKSISPPFIWTKLPLWGRQVVFGSIPIRY